jgi:rhodanese-related sulfurtransferase
MAVRSRTTRVEDYENAYEYEGGKQDWTDAGYPTESGG